MLTKIIMPSGGQTINESLIVKWHKKVGDIVSKGDILFEIETDKAVMEIESFAEGNLLGIKYPEGEYAATGDVVAYIGDEGENLPEVNIYTSKTLASPAARHLARSEKIALDDVAESTSSNPLKRADVENYVYLIDTSTMRKVIAE